LHYIDPLIVIDLERGLGVRLLVRATRSAVATVRWGEISRSRQLPARPGKSAQTDRIRRITWWCGDHGEIVIKEM
jgi:hypothetical protein